MDRPVEINRDLIKTNGWCQGATSPAGSLSLIYRPPWFEEAMTSQSAIAILISHDCDILNPSLTKEPTADWLVAVPIKKLNSHCTNGMNCRTFHFEHDGVKYETTAHRKVSTPREALQSQSPAGAPLRRALTDNLVNWLSKKLMRPAFPDGFNARLSEVDKKIRAGLEANHSCLASIFIKVDPSEELPMESVYEVSLLGIMRGIDYSDGDSRVKGEAVLDALEQHLSACNGICVVNSELKPQERVTLSIFDEYVQWDFDFLSFRDEDA
jgi:hypothetical protein